MQNQCGQALLCDEKKPQPPDVACVTKQSNRNFDLTKEVGVVVQELLSDESIHVRVLCHKLIHRSRDHIEQRKATLAWAKLHDADILPSDVGNKPLMGISQEGI